MIPSWCGGTVARGCVNSEKNAPFRILTVGGGVGPVEAFEGARARDVDQESQPSRVWSEARVQIVSRLCQVEQPRKQVVEK
jgi:hypothetical protein